MIQSYIPIPGKYGEEMFLWRGPETYEPLVATSGVPAENLALARRLEEGGRDLLLRDPICEAVTFDVAR
jgi:hypothetical protein